MKPGHVVLLLLAVLIAVGIYGARNTPTITPATTDVPQCWQLHDGINQPCASHGKLRTMVEWRITDKQGLDHDCWRLAMTLAHPGPDDPDESNFTDCNSKDTYDRYQIGDSYWSPDSMTQLAG